MLLVLLIKILCIFNEATQNLGSFGQMMKNVTLNFIDQKWASPKSTTCHFHNCTVNFYNGENSVQHQNHNRKRKRCVVYSSDSSDE